MNPPCLCNLWPGANRYYAKLSSIFFPLQKLHLSYICSLVPQLKWTQTSVLQLSSQLLNFTVYLELTKIIILIFVYLHWYSVTCKFYNGRYVFLERLWKALHSSQDGQANLCHKIFIYPRSHENAGFLWRWINNLGKSVFG